MRIVHLLTDGEISGGEAIALRLARAAKDRGHDVGFVAPTDGPALTAARAEGFDAHVLRLTRMYRVRDAVALARLLRRTKTDLLHTHTQVVPNVLGRAAARLAGARVVSHLHIENHFRSQRLPRAAYRAADNATARLCERVIAVSEATRDALVEQGYPRDRIELVLNGVDPEPSAATASLREELAIPPDVPLVGQVARLAEVKGQRVLIEALAELPDVHAVLIGKDVEFEGAYQGELERLAERHAVADRIVFAGYVPDAPARLAEIDVVVLPSFAEGLPLVLLEALAAARPVVATPVGGTPELVEDGETGLLVPPGDARALAHAVRRLLDDRELASRLGGAGRRRVLERFSAERQVERVLAIYDEVAN